MADATVGRHARGIFSDRIALVCSSGEEGAQQTLTYRELDLEARRCAKFLKLHGVRRGDVVICYTPQGLTAALTHLAAYLIGAIVAPLSLFVWTRHIASRHERQPSPHRRDNTAGMGRTAGTSQ